MPQVQLRVPQLAQWAEWSNNTAGTAVNGTVNSTSHGVVGLQGLTLISVSTGSAQGSVITSATQNIKLDAGTQMVLQVVGSAK